MSFNSFNAEHARQRIITDQLRSIRDSLELIEEALTSQWFKVCPECGQADLATDLHAIYCILCGAPLAHVTLANDPKAHTACDETCTRVRCGYDPRRAPAVPPGSDQATSPARPSASAASPSDSLRE